VAGPDADVTGTGVVAGGLGTEDGGKARDLGCMLPMSARGSSALVWSTRTLHQSVDTRGLRLGSTKGLTESQEAVVAHYSR
jgi:hypothetical protein